jgi:hypothetical protein
MGLWNQRHNFLHVMQARSRLRYRLTLVDLADLPLQPPECESDALLIELQLDMVDLAGDAPATSALPARRAPNRAPRAQKLEPPVRFALTPAGYKPATLLLRQSGKWRSRRELPRYAALTMPHVAVTPRDHMATLVGIPPTRFGSANRCSMCLSYKVKMATTPGFKPGISAFGEQRSIR